MQDNLDVDSTTENSVTLLQEVQNVLPEEELPEGQEFADEVPCEEDLQLHEGSIEKEEDEVEEEQANRKDGKEEAAADSEKMDRAGEEVDMEQEDEDTKMVESMDEKEKQESEEHAEKEAYQEEEMLVEDNKEDKYEEEEENESKGQSCTLDDEQDIKLDTSIKIESFHESDQSIDSSATVSVEIVNQPEDLLAPECTEQPSFVVMTSLELSFPKKTSNPPNEDVPEILQEDTSEQHDILEECEDQPTENSQEAHQEEVLCASQQSSTSESETAKESIQEVSLSETDVFDKSPSKDQPSESVRAEPSASQVETRSLPSSPLQREICQADEDTTPENPFGVRLRKTPVFHRYASEGESPTPNTDPMETQKALLLEQPSRKPALSKKPDQVSDGAAKPRRTSGINCTLWPNWLSGFNLSLRMLLMARSQGFKGFIYRIHRTGYKV